LERQLRGKAAGIRTSILICLGTQLFVGLGASFAGERVGSDFWEVESFSPAKVPSSG
jgi:uncharacterized membrane protein YhiD involved in acid resistance